MIKRLIKYLLGGLSIVLPIAALCYILYFFYQKLQEISDIESGLILLALVIVALIVIGFARTYFNFKLFFLLESFLVKTPLLGPLYKAIKDVTSAFVGAESKFSEPVLVQYTGELYKIGFVTNKENEYLNKNIEDDENRLISVYFPLSFSLSGDLFIVPKHRIQPIDKKANEVMQLIVSGGLIKGKKLEHKINEKSPA